MTNYLNEYQKLYGGVIYDTLEFDIKIKKPFCITNRVQRVTYHTKPMFGPVFTCEGNLIKRKEDINDDLRIEMLSDFKDGCVQVMDCNGYEDVALYGDVTAALAMKFGAIGAVIDGYTRDIDKINDNGFDMFCYGFNVRSALDIWQITNYDCQITMNGIDGKVTINPDDYVFGDSDGVMIIPEYFVDDVLEGAQERMKNENYVREKLVSSSIDELLKMKEEVVVW